MCIAVRTACLASDGMRELDRVVCVASLNIAVSSNRKDSSDKLTEDVALRMACCFRLSALTASA